MQIALRAGQGKILFIVRPAMLLRDDVLNLICDERLIGLAGAAVFAATARSLPNKLPSRGTDHDNYSAFRTERALACRTEMRLMPLTSDWYSVSSSGVSCPS